MQVSSNYFDFFGLPHLERVLGPGAVPNKCGATIPGVPARAE